MKFSSIITICILPALYYILHEQSGDTQKSQHFNKGSSDNKKDPLKHKKAMHIDENSSDFQFKNMDFVIRFAPQEDCDGAIVHMIDHTNHSIKICAYAFTSDKIIQALIRAANRGVKIRLLVDKTYAHKESTYSINELPTGRALNDATPKIAHNKTMIFCNRGNTEDFSYAVLTGSFNFSYSAQHVNAENITIILNNEYYFNRFQENWKYRKHLKGTARITRDPNKQKQESLLKR